jgi:hypothetical protein
MSHISEAKLKANRKNAQHSTGPRSEAAKKKVALNSLTHGFAGQTVLIPAHEEDAYSKHFQDFRAEYQPKGPTERFLVQSLAELSWATQQIRCQINNYISLAGAKCPPMAESGNPETDFSISQASALDSFLPKINLLGIYEQRKQRLFNTTRRELAEIQEARKEAEKEELIEAAHARQTSPSNWNPAADGFACSLPEIDRYIALQKRRSRHAGGQK